MDQKKYTISLFGEFVDKSLEDEFLAESLDASKNNSVHGPCVRRNTRAFCCGKLHHRRRYSIICQNYTTLGWCSS